MAEQLPFEKPIIELRNKISELKTFTIEKEIDLSGEIEKLEARLDRRRYLWQYDSLGSCSIGSS